MQKMALNCLKSPFALPRFLKSSKSFRYRNHVFSFNRHHHNDYPIELFRRRNFKPFPGITQQQQFDESDSILFLPSIRHGLANDVQRNFRDFHTSPKELMPDESSKGKKNKIKYSIVPREKSKKISRFLIAHYHHHEPMTAALGMPIREVEGWFKRFIRMSMFASVSDVSVEAIDGKAKKRVGVLSSVVIDPSKVRVNLHQYTDAIKHPVNTEMNEFYDKLEDGICPSTKPVKPGEIPPKIIEHLYVSVHPDYSRRGICSHMIHLSESLALNIINLRLGYTVATSEFSYKVFEKAGYKTVREVKYADYVNNKGEKIFLGREEQLRPHISVKAMIKEFPDMYAKQ